MSTSSLIAAAFAEGGAAAPGSSPFISMAPLILLFVIFYFLLIRPQQKKAKEHKQMLSELTKGDYIITTGGLHGRVLSVNDGNVTVEIADNVRVKVTKEAVAVNRKSNAG